MRRRLFTLCSDLSLLLCAALAVLWVRSYSVVDDFALRSEGWALVVRFHRGVWEVFYSAHPVNAPGWTTHTMSHFDDPGTVAGREWFVWKLRLPTLFVLAMVAVVPPLPPLPPPPGAPAVVPPLPPLPPPPGAPAAARRSNSSPPARPC